MAENNKKSNSFSDLLKEGQELYKNEKYKEAVKVFKMAYIMTKKLDNLSLGSLYINLANSYYKLQDIDKYTYYYEEYLKLFPEGQASIFSRLAHAYYYFDVDKTIDYDNKALNMQINKFDIVGKLFAMTKSPYYTQEDLKEESEIEAARLKNAEFSKIKKYSHENKKKLKNKKLNIAYLSSDCRAHTMMSYILPIWENHNKEEFNIFIFNASEKEDRTTENIKKIGHEVIKCSGMPIEKLAKLIYDKQIDILIDLGGYTHILSFVSFYKPAPIIMSYLGYLNTLGIKETDYIIADKYSIPEDKAYLYTEKPLYLKNYQVFIEKNMPDIVEKPYKSNGYITFGSFNCLSKINDTVVYMWSEILKAVPDSKLLIYRTQLKKKNILMLSEKFEKRGINPERIIFDSKKLDVHFRAYTFADIALDPYPFNGMSIAIEAARMGLPTVTLVGEGIQSRGVGRINQMLNLSELNAYCGDDYINIAVNLANNKKRLDELHDSLRDTVNNSELVKGAKEFTRDLEEKYKQAWEIFTNSP